MYSVISWQVQPSRQSGLFADSNHAPTISLKPWISFAAISDILLTCDTFYGVSHCFWWPSSPFSDNFGYIFSKFITFRLIPTKSPDHFNGLFHFLSIQGYRRQFYNFALGLEFQGVMPRMAHRKAIFQVWPHWKASQTGRIRLVNLPWPLWKDNSTPFLVPDSLGKCFWYTPREFPFHTPVWVKNKIAQLSKLRHRSI